MKLSTLIAMAALTIVSAGAAQAEDPIDGKKLFNTRTCMACHGMKGAKPIQSYPALAGQNEKYALQQIKDIKDGKRVGGLDETGHPRTEGMAAILHILNDAEIAALAKYVSEQTPAAPKPLDPAPTPEELKAGQDSYKKLGCVTCHGADAKKTNSPIYPILGGLHRDYLIRQMTEMRDGQRAGGQSKVMLPFIKKADDAAIQSIATWLSQVDRSAQ
jgi:cytochrome c553